MRFILINIIPVRYLMMVHLLNLIVVIPLQNSLMLPHETVQHLLQNICLRTYFAIYPQEYQIYTMIMEQLQETVPLTAAELVKVDKDLGLSVGKYNL